MKMAMKLVRRSHFQVRASDPPTWRTKDIAGNHNHLWDRRAPSWFGRGVALHKVQTSVGQHDRDHRGNFTQVRAAVRRKTLLMLWWIDGGKNGGEHNTLGRVASTNPFYGCLGPPFIDKGVTTVANKPLCID